MHKYVRCRGRICMNFWRRNIYIICYNVMKNLHLIRCVVEFSTTTFAGKPGFKNRNSICMVHSDYELLCCNTVIIIIILLPPPSQLRSCLFTGCSSSPSSLSVSPGVSRISITSFIIAAKGYAKKEGAPIGIYLLKNLKKKPRV